MTTRQKRTEVIRARVEPDLHRDFSTLAAEQGRTPSDLLRHIANQYVQRERRTKHA